MRGRLVSTLLVAALGLLGCNGQSASAPASGSPENSGTVANTAVQARPATQPIAVPAAAAPEQVITVFLNALRGGDSPTTESLLTAKAREELAKHSMSVDVQPAPDAIFEIRAAQILPDNVSGAHVSSIWTEKFEGGEETYEIVWVLRHQPEGWRVAGLMTQLIPDQAAQFLNFENPADMLKKKEEAMAAMEAPAAQTAQQPGLPAASSPPAIER